MKAVRDPAEAGAAGESPAPDSSCTTTEPRTEIADQVDDSPGPFGTYPWLLIGYNAFDDVISGRARPVWASGPLLAVYTGLLVVAIWYGYRRGQGDRLAVALLAAAGVDAFVLVGWFGHGMNELMPTLALGCGVVIPWGRRPWPAMVIAPLSIAAGLLAWIRGASAGDAIGSWYGTLISGFIIAFLLRLFAAIRELRATREELARTAVSEERLRFARDLHDLLGHTLSVMVVKAQAARKLAPRDAELAASQAADIEEIGRDALRQVRLAVSGYRGRGLAAEIDGARTALRDAGITATVRQEGTPCRRRPTPCSAGPYARASPTSSGTAARRRARSRWSGRGAPPSCPSGTTGAELRRRPRRPRATACADSSSGSAGRRAGSRPVRPTGAATDSPSRCL